MHDGGSDPQSRVQRWASPRGPPRLASRQLSSDPEGDVPLPEPPRSPDLERRDLATLGTPVAALLGDLQQAGHLAEGEDRHGHLEALGRNSTLRGAWQTWTGLSNWLCSFIPEAPGAGEPLD